MRIRYAPIVLLAAATTIAAPACRSGTTLQSRGMVVLPGAQHIRVGDAHDGSVAYQLAEAYPADRVIQQVRAELRRMEWRPRPTDFLNGSPFSVTARWRDLEVDRRVVTVWSEQWQNRAGDVVWYSYTYDRPIGIEPPPSLLQVEVVYFRRERLRE